MAEFLMNCWYMAGWGHELAEGGTLARRLVDLPLVFYRTSDGSPAAMIDRCPHRFAPLSRGEVIGDTLQCGYHGLRFDKTGACVFNHFDGATPPGAKVRAFPVVQRDNILWFWPGDAPADESLIPSFPTHTDPAYDFIWGKSLVPAHYELITDNLMDLSHVTFIHPGFGGGTFQPKMTMERDGDTVTAVFFTENMPIAPFGKVSFPQGEQIDELDRMRWNAPASMLLDVYRNHTGEDPKQGGHNPSAHILTPETATSTHYFWGSGMPTHLNADQELHQKFLIQAFETEDKPMIGAVQEAMEGADFWELNPAILSVDKVSVMVRRTLRKKMRAEQGQSDIDTELETIA